MKSILKSKKGEGYIEVIIATLCYTMVIILSINVFSFLTLKQNMDYYAKEMIKVAMINGKTAGAEIEKRKAELTAETGLSPTVVFEAVYFNSMTKAVQLGETITVRLTLTSSLKGFGVFNFPVALTARHSGLSQRYWKSD